MEKCTHHTCDTYTRTTYIGNIRVLLRVANFQHICRRIILYCEYCARSTLLELEIT